MTNTSLRRLLGLTHWAYSCFESIEGSAMSEDLYTVEQAADMLGVSRQRLYVLRWEGRGPVAWRRGNRLVYPQSGIEQYLAEERLMTTKGGSL